MAPKQAAAHRLQNGDYVAIEYEGRSIEIPIWIVPGHAEKAITVHLGYGRARGGHVATGAGTDVYPLRSFSAPYQLHGVRLQKLGRR